VARLADLLEDFDGAAEDHLRALRDDLFGAIGGRAADIVRKIDEYDYPAALVALRAAQVAEPRLAGSPCPNPS
jgi:hypothetical protein